MQKPVKLVSLAERKVHKGWSDYFGVLSFSELIGEVEDIISELDGIGVEGEEILVRAQKAMGEFYSRVGNESIHFAKSILGMKNDVDAKVDTFKSNRS